MSTAPTRASSRLMITLIVVGGILVLAIVAVIFLLIGRNLNQAESPASLVGASATPAATAPSATPQPAAAAPKPTTAPPQPKPVDKSTRFTSFHPVTQVKCVANSDTKPVIQVSWSSANAVSAWYTANNGDAANDKYMQIPLSGNQTAFTDEHLFDCFHRPTQDYTLTLVAPNGQHISEHWTVTNVGDQ